MDVHKDELSNEKKKKEERRRRRFTCVSVAYADVLSKGDTSQTIENIAFVEENRLVKKKGE